MSESPFEDARRELSEALAWLSPLALSMDEDTATVEAKRLVRSVLDRLNGPSDHALREGICTCRRAAWSSRTETRSGRRAPVGVSAGLVSADQVSEQLRAHLRFTAKLFGKPAPGTFGYRTDDTDRTA